MTPMHTHMMYLCTHTHMPAFSHTCKSADITLGAGKLAQCAYGNARRFGRDHKKSREAREKIAKWATTK